MKWLILILIAVMATFALAFTAERYEFPQRSERTMSGSTRRGRNLIPYYGCPSCHTIPGITGVQGKVGPSLAGVSGRVYIAGVLPNNVDNLVRWIRDPRAISPKTDMPFMSIPESDARDIAAYLITLK